MNLTPLERRALRHLGRVKRVLSKNVKKNRALLKQVLTLALAVPLVIPVGVVTAAYDTSVPSSVSVEPVYEAQVTVAYNEKIVVEPEKTVSFELQESEYQKKQRQARKPVTRQPVKKPVVVSASTQTPDPGFAVKRAWAQQAAAAYGIDWKLLEAVWQIESGKSWYMTKSSYAGAQGPCQFMPGTWRGYAHDGNGDGIKNVNDARDCLYGSAKLLAANGAASGDHRRALFAYNHSQHYVNTVLRIVASI